jgi:long-chain fatty acid transport protein
VKYQRVFTLPDMISINGAYSLTDKVKLLAGAYYTVWSTIQSITMQNIAAPTGSSITQTVPLNLNNTWRFVLGTQVDVNNKLLIRGGAGFDQSIVNRDNRSIRSPDNDRIAVAVGAKYKLNKTFYIDFGYTYIFIKKADIDRTLETYTQRSRVAGDVKNHVHLLALQLTANIC